MMSVCHCPFALGIYNLDGTAGLSTFIAEFGRSCAFHRINDLTKSHCRLSNPWPKGPSVFHMSVANLFEILNQFKKNEP